MTIWQSFMGTLMENATVLTLMSLFSPVYTKSKGRFISAIIISAVVVTFGEYIHLPIVIRFIVNYGFAAVFYSLFFHRKLQYTLFEFLFAIDVSIVIEFLLIVLQNFFWPGNLEVWQSFVHLGILLGLSIVCTKFVRMVISFQAFYETYRQSFCLVTISIFAVLLLELFIWDTARYSLYANLGLICLFILMWLVLNFYLLKVLVTDERKKTLVSAYEQYEETTETLLDCLYSDQHEYNRHLQTILRMCEENDTTKTEIMTYVMEMGQNEDKEKQQIFLCPAGSGLINGLIYTKAKEAADNNIKLIHLSESKVPSFPCLNYELIELLGNLLDNALEYLKKQPKNKAKEIYLDLGYDQGKVFIKVKNSYYAATTESEFWVKKGYTTKSSSKHGYGLYNVKQIVAKYKGDFNIFTEALYINICIYFENSNGKSDSI
ncbi:sensor histidine kinase [Aminipila butyrica]|uniref:Sensor histidine kinase n=1 Tax=Aminipila butyrica TaxID=433296 RepID=A0A858BXX1_9FIRM|nr:GHKL domain-containing protein [Aminipila butyrica]QIB69945.1 sensor histidine kinase [Aminipila butyrica]